MFYESQLIEKKFDCPSCKSRIKIPKCLPCGIILCDICAGHLCEKRESNSDYIMCSQCNKQHKIPTQTGEFPTQMLLLELIQLKPIKPFRGALFEKFDKKLKDLDTMLDEFKTFIDYSEGTIKMHCNFLRDETDVSTESAISELHKYRNEIINEINLFEMNACKSLESEKVEMRKCLDQSIPRYQSLYELSKKPEINKTQIHASIKEASKLLENLNKFKNDYDNLVKIGCMIRYSKKRSEIKKVNIGYLKYDDDESGSNSEYESTDDDYVDNPDEEEKDEEDDEDDDDYDDDIDENELNDLNFS